MLGFLIGLFVGGITGVSVMALVNVAAAADKRLERHDRNGAKNL